MRVMSLPPNAAMPSYNAPRIVVNINWRERGDERRDLESGQRMGCGLERS